MSVKDKTIRHAHFVERYKTGLSNTVDDYIRQVDRLIRDLLSKSETIADAKKLREIQKKVRLQIFNIYSDWNNQVNNDLVDFAVSEANFASRAASARLFIPSRYTLKAAIQSRPFLNRLLRDELNDFARIEARNIKNAIAQGFYAGESNAQITRAIRGTAANNFNDGMLAISKRRASRIVRTAVNHTAARARVALIEANADVYSRYEWIATLDQRTSDICRDLNGKKYKAGSGGPLPPAHPNCRSTILPVE